MKKIRKVVARYGCAVLSHRFSADSSHTILGEQYTCKSGCGGIAHLLLQQPVYG